MINLDNALQKIQNRDVRQFYLINDIGEIFDMTSHLENKDEQYQAFFNNPDGLGFEFENTYNSIYYYDVLTDRQWTNSDYTGELVFRSYSQHSSFEYFVSRTSKLYLAYISPLEGLYQNSNLKTYAECSIVTAPMNEIKFDDSLIRIDTTIHLLEPMKSPKMISKGITIDKGDDTKTYPYSYDKDNNDSYIYGKSSGSFIIIDNIGTAPTFPLIKITGPSSEPSISIKNYNTGEVNQVVAIQQALIEGDEILFNSDPLDSYLTVNGLNGYDYLDKDLDVYLVIPPGKYIITLEAEEGSMEVQYELKFY